MHGLKSIHFKVSIAGVWVRIDQVLTFSIAWTEKGLSGRGVLLDWASWAIRSGKQFSTFEKCAIELDDLKAVARDQNVTFRTGDVLFLRTGYVNAYRSMTAEERIEVAGKREWIGLGQGKETTEWLWERQFAAVASDSPGFECRRECWKDWLLLILTGHSSNRPCVASPSHPARRMGNPNRRALRP